MALEDWIDLKRIQPQIGQCDDGAYDAAACQNLECLRDEVANIYDILTLTGNNGTADYTDTVTDGQSDSSEGNADFEPVMDEIPPGVHSECSNTITVTTRFCGAGSGDNTTSTTGQFRVELYCEPERGGTPVLMGTSTHTAPVTYSGGDVTCSSQPHTFSGISCTGRLLVKVFRTAGNVLDLSNGTWTSAAQAFCVD